MPLCYFPLKSCTKREPFSYNKEKGSFVYQAIMSDSKNGKVVLPRKSLSLKREYEITILFEKNGKKKLIIIDKCFEIDGKS